MKNYKQAFINSSFFAPPERTVEEKKQIRKYSTLIKNKVPFSIYTPEKQQQPLELIKNNDKKILIKILYCHGRDEDLEMESLDLVLTHLVDTLARVSTWDPPTENHTLDFKLMAIDYPGYGASTELTIDSDTEVLEWVEMAAEELFNKTFDEQPYERTIRVIWGYSIGTSFCCRLLGSSLKFHDDIDLCLLEAPFHSVLKSQKRGTLTSGAIWLLTDESMDRLQNADALVRARQQGGRCKIITIYGTKDTIVDFKINSPVFKKVSDVFLVIKGGTHDWFREIEGINHSCCTLLDNIDKILNPEALPKDQKKNNATKQESKQGQHNADQEKKERQATTTTTTTRRRRRRKKNKEQQRTYDGGEESDDNYSSCGSATLYEEPENTQFLRVLGGEGFNQESEYESKGAVQFKINNRENYIQNIYDYSPNKHEGYGQKSGQGESPSKQNWGKSEISRFRGDFCGDSKEGEVLILNTGSVSLNDSPVNAMDVLSRLYGVDSEID